jgi:hypothetical protein
MLKRCAKIESPSIRVSDEGGEEVRGSISLSLSLSGSMVR